ncbi:MAG TPA: hypothetical protein VE402_08890 [Candidatus Angelobacter sp.]|nr:hypothetical protein [Candidatus Angelobacter sp.]
MKPITGALLGGVLILASLGAAFGQGSDPAASGAASTTTGTQSTLEPQQQPAPPTQLQAETQAQTEARAEASADPAAALKTVRDRAKGAPSKARDTVEKKLAEISTEIDAEASAKGDAVVADRVAAEFGMTSEALSAEQNSLNTGWGDLVIAHTLLANAKTPLTAEHLYSLHRSGYGWGQIAYGLNLRLGEVAAAVKSEGGVATGFAKADGKAAMIHSGTRVGAGTKTTTGAGKTTVGASSGIGVGVKLGK